MIFDHTGEVSVIIPTLDRVDRLSRALKSVEWQTSPPSEIVVVDGSDGESARDVLSKIAIKTTYVPQEGYGLSNARNIGIEESRNDLIAFLDDDDWWLPRKLEQQMNTLRNSSASFSHTGIVYMTKGGSVLNVKRPNKSPDMPAILTRNHIGTPSTILASKTSLESIGGFDEDLESREEWDLYIRLLQDNQSVSVSEPLVVKEVHGDSMSRDIGLIERDWKLLYAKHRDKYDPAHDQLFWANYHFVLGRKYAENGEMDSARNQFLRSIKVRPEPSRFGHLIASALGSECYTMLAQLRRDFRVVMDRIRHRTTDYPSHLNVTREP